MEFKLGDIVNMAGQEWTIFKKDEKGVYAILNMPFEREIFSRKGINDYSKSDIRLSLLNSHLHFRLRREMGEKLVPITLDLKNYNDSNEYGQLVGDTLSLLTYDLYQECRNIIPCCEKWFWLATPHGNGSSRALCVGSNGGVYYDWAGGDDWVRPFCILNL